jgi:hypothetical protein
LHAGLKSYASVEDTTVAYASALHAFEHSGGNYAKRPVFIPECSRKLSAIPARGISYLMQTRAVNLLRNCENPKHAAAQTSNVYRSSIQNFASNFNVRMHKQAKADGRALQLAACSSWHNMWVIQLGLQ